MTDVFPAATDGANILIVDDERRNQQVLEVMLAEEGFRIRTASNGTEALSMVAEQAPDLILLDIMMPIMNGYEVTRRLKGALRTRHIPIILVSALDDRRDKMVGLRAGAEDFLSKPVDRSELCLRVRNLLRLKAHGDFHDQHSQLLEMVVAERTSELTERTEALEAQAVLLATSEARTIFALRAARMGTWELDIASRQLMWSPTLAPLFGLTSEEAPRDAHAFMQLVHADDRAAMRTSLSAMIEQGGRHDMHFRVVWPDNSVHWMAGRAELLRDKSGHPVRVVGVASDIEEHKQLEEQFRHAQKTEAVGQLAAGVAHDFNNILTVIMLYSNFVLDSLDEHDRRRADLAEVVTAGERATALTRQLLAFSRKQVLQPTAIDVNALVDGMQRMLKPLLGEGIQLIAVLAPNLASVRADRGQLEQVLLNLVVNGRDAMPNGGRLVIETAPVELDDAFTNGVAVRPGRYAMLAVTDSGTGMTDDVKERLFEPFFTTKPVGSGTGLGLATAYGIVKQSGGYIWVYSELGVGTTFKVYLPYSSEADVESVAPPVQPAVGRGHEAVLLVEDELTVRQLMRRILEGAGYEVFDSADPAEALRQFSEAPDRFELIVTDVAMQGLTGPRLVEQLVAIRPDVKVLYVSGYTDDAIGHLGHLGVAPQYLQKPFTADALRRAVREVLDGGDPVTTQTH